MEIDVIQYRKHSITVSQSGAGTYADLLDIHTVKDVDGVLWGAPDVDYAWLTVNVYQRLSLSSINLYYNGSASLMGIEVSLNGINWDVLVDDFTPIDGEVNLTIDDIEYVFIRFMVYDTSSFQITSLSINSPVEIDVSHFISHNYLDFYGDNELEHAPFFSEMSKDLLQMMENLNELDMSLFDPTNYVSSSITKTNEVPDVSFTMTPSNFPVDGGVKYYIWDFDDPQYEFLDENRSTPNPIYDANNPNIVVTTNLDDFPSHTYSGDVGLYVPRIIIKHEKYLLEFTTYFNKTV